jgi:hypothetical protein
VNRYLVVTEMQGETPEGGGYPETSERAYEFRAQSPEEAAEACLNPLQLQPGWSVQRVRVYELAGDEPPWTKMVVPAPQWVVHDPR